MLIPIRLTLFALLLPLLFSFCLSEHRGRLELPPELASYSLSTWKTLTPEERSQECESKFSDLYSTIDDDLARWQEPGISLELMQKTVKAHTTRTHNQKGFVAAFLNGKAYIVDRPRLEQDWIGHHAGLFFTYMKVLLHLEQTFGELIPDVEFVISTVDRC